jgi:hypothetical protein
MVRAFLFLFLYGSNVLVGLFLTTFWAKVAYRRVKAINDRWGLHTDRYFVLSAAIAMCAAGLLLIDLGRLIGNLAYGLSPILQHWEGDWLIAPGLVLLSIGGMGMVWLADLEARKPNWKWTKAMVAVTLIWFAVALFVAPKVPFYPAGLEPVHTPQEAVQCKSRPVTISC